MKPRDRTELEAKPRALTAMVRPPIIVVVDRGTMKGYEMEQVLIHGWVPHLLQEITFSETHGRYRDRYTDQAGAFPVTGTLGYGGVGLRMARASCSFELVIRYLFSG